MSKTTENIAKLIEAGANVTVPADKATDMLVILAKLAKQKGTRLTISSADGKSTDKLLEIIAAGGGQVDIIL